MSIDFSQPGGACPWCGAPIYLKHSQELGDKYPWAVHTCSCRERHTMTLGGYQPEGRGLDVRNPPKGGSGLGKVSKAAFIVDEDQQTADGFIKDIESQIKTKGSAKLSVSNGIRHVRVRPPEVDLVLYHFHKLNYVAYAAKRLIEIHPSDFVLQTHYSIWDITVEGKP